MIVFKTTWFKLYDLLYLASRNGQDPVSFPAVKENHPLTMVLHFYTEIAFLFPLYFDCLLNKLKKWSKHLQVAQMEVSSLLIAETHIYYNMQFFIECLKKKKKNRGKEYGI